MILLTIELRILLSGFASSRPNLLATLPVLIVRPAESHLAGTSFDRTLHPFQAQISFFRFLESLRVLTMGLLRVRRLFYIPAQYLPSDSARWGAPPHHSTDNNGLSGTLHLLLFIFIIFIFAPHENAEASPLRATGMLLSLGYTVVIGNLACLITSQGDRARLRLEIDIYGQRCVSLFL